MEPGTIENKIDSYVNTLANPDLITGYYYYKNVHFHSIKMLLKRKINPEATENNNSSIANDIPHLKDLAANAAFKKITGKYSKIEKMHAVNAIASTIRNNAFRSEFIKSLTGSHNSNPLRLTNKRVKGPGPSLAIRRAGITGPSNKYRNTLRLNRGTNRPTKKPSRISFGTNNVRTFTRNSIITNMGK